MIICSAFIFAFIVVTSDLGRVTTKGCTMQVKVVSIVVTSDLGRVTTKDSKFN